MAKQKWTDADVVLVAALARCAKVTAAKYLRGEKVRGGELNDRLRAAASKAREIGTGGVKA